MHLDFPLNIHNTSYRIHSIWTQFPFLSLLHQAHANQKKQNDCSFTRITLEKVMGASRAAGSQGVVGQVNRRSLWCNSSNKKTGSSSGISRARQSAPHVQSNHDWFRETGWLEVGVKLHRVRICIPTYEIGSSAFVWCTSFVSIDV